MGIASIKRYINTATGQATETAVLLVLVTALYIALLYALSFVWLAYSSTPIGEWYIISDPVASAAINDVLGDDLLPFSISLIMAVCKICILAAVVFQLLHISRYLYTPSGTMKRMIFFGLPAALLSSYYVKSECCSDQFWLAFCAVMVPVLCILPACFRLCSVLLPELGDVLAFAKDLVKQKAASPVLEVKEGSDLGSTPPSVSQDQGLPQK